MKLSKAQITICIELACSTLAVRGAKLHLATVSNEGLGQARVDLMYAEAACEHSQYAFDNACAAANESGKRALLAELRAQS